MSANRALIAEVRKGLAAAADPARAVGQQAYMKSGDFFIRRAIGWSLRAYAWVDPREIGRYVRANQARLSGLSRREALKNIGSALE
jgi:3-methyladenine DNA glycosylase AlkD